MGRVAGRSGDGTAVVRSLSEGLALGSKRGPKVPRSRPSAEGGDKKKAGAAYGKNPKAAAPAASTTFCYEL